MIFSYFTNVKLFSQKDPLKLWLNSLTNVGLIFPCTECFREAQTPVPVSSSSIMQVQYQSRHTDNFTLRRTLARVLVW